MKRLSFLSLFIFFLMGCSFDGIMSQTYDGGKVTADTEAVKLFEEENKLKTEGLEQRYGFLNSDTVFENVAGGEEIILSPGKYSAAEDIAPGRYSIFTEEASAIAVYDERNVRVLEVSLNYFNPEAVVTLQEGYQLEYAARSGSITLIPDMKTFEKVIPAGIHRIGENFKAGNYMLMTRELPVRRADNTNEVYLNTSGFSVSVLSSQEFETEPEYSIPVELNEGDTIVTEHPIMMEKY